jgi:hypothetical protein
LPAAKDYAFVFTPRGKLLANDLPNFDGAYHLVVSHGGRSTPASVPGTGVMTTQPTMHSLTQVGSPYTVTIDPAGSVSVSLGLVAMAVGGVAVKDQAAMDAPPDPPALATPPSSVPLVTSVALLPDPAKLKLSDGAHTLLAPGRHMSITTRAKSLERAPLFCRWTATGGGVSSGESVRMTYLPVSQEWESIWHWQTPTDASPGDRFSIQGRVHDRHGHESPVELGSGVNSLVIEIRDPGLRAVFHTPRDGNSEVYRINTDGTNLVNLTQALSGENHPLWSPDGQSVLFLTARDGNQEIYMMNADGTGQTNLTNHPATDGNFSEGWPDLR